MSKHKTTHDNFYFSLHSSVLGKDVLQRIKLVLFVIPPKHLTYKIRYCKITNNKFKHLIVQSANIYGNNWFIITNKEEL